jgi:HAD superfamily hydrolase (TIGR01450 family)
MLTTQKVFERYEDIRPRLPQTGYPQTTSDIASILEISDEMDAFIFDAFGVLNLGDQLIAGADFALKELRSAGKEVRVLTNAASYDKAGAVKKFSNLGIRFDTQEIITSRDAAIKNLTPGLWGIISAADDKLDDLSFNYIRLKNDTKAYDKVDGFLFLSTSDWNSQKQLFLKNSILKNDRPVIIANADLVAPRESGFTLEPGFYGHELIDLGASNVKFFGKPYPEVYSLVTKSLSGVPGEKIAMCGDSLHTDILGAAAQGWKTVLVTKDGLFSGFETQSYSEESGIFANWRLDRLYP